MRAFTLLEYEAVGGGVSGIVGTVALIVVAGWIWDNREALNEIAQTAALDLADLDAECRNP